MLFFRQRNNEFDLFHIPDAYDGDCNEEKTGKSLKQACLNLV